MRGHAKVSIPHTKHQEKKEMGKTTLDLTPESVNAIHDAVGALVFALTLEMPKERRAALSQQLARLAQSKTSGGAILAGTVLLDYAAAAEFAEKNS